MGDPYQVSVAFSLPSDGSAALLQKLALCIPVPLCSLNLKSLGKIHY